MKYAWIITRDRICHIAEGERSAVGTCGPRGISPELLERLKCGEGVTFRLFDDDGEHYYSGRIIADDPAFQPLDDFGAGWAGCTMIAYRNKETRKWETL
jgi:hypothetical protein